MGEKNLRKTLIFGNQQVLTKQQDTTCCPILLFCVRDVVQPQLSFIASQQLLVLAASVEFCFESFYLLVTCVRSTE